MPLTEANILTWAAKAFLIDINLQTEIKPEKSEIKKWLKSTKKKKN